MQWIALALSLSLTAFNAHSAPHKPKLAIIIDDLGYHSMPDQISSLPPQVTIAIIPFTHFDQDVANAAKEQQREVMVHLPMQSPVGTPLEDTALTLKMNKQDMQQRVSDALHRVPYAIAVNNHMGSVLTQHHEPMHWLMELLSQKQLGFIDSRTSASTVAQEIAEHHGLANNRRHVFIDHHHTEAFVYRQLKQAVAQAKRQGLAVAIAHPLPITLKALNQMLPQIQAEVELIPISEALEFPASRQTVKANLDLESTPDPSAVTQ